MSGSLQGSCQGSSRHALSTSSELTAIPGRMVVGSCQGHSKVTLRSLQGLFRVTSGSFQGHFKVMSGSFQGHFRATSGHRAEAARMPKLQIRTPTHISPDQRSPTLSNLIRRQQKLRKSRIISYNSSACCCRGLIPIHTRVLPRCNASNARHCKVTSGSLQGRFTGNFGGGIF